MEKLNKGPLAETLARNRANFNARFKEASRPFPSFSEEAFAQFLKETLEPLAKLISEVEASRLDGAVGALYDMAVEWIGRDWPGASNADQPLRRAWFETLTACPVILARDTAQFSASVFNAAYQLHSHNLDLDAWTQTMTNLGRRTVDFGEFQRWGLVAAWRSGLAQYRSTALDILSRLTAEIGSDLLRLPKMEDSKWTGVLESIRKNPWQLPTQIETKRRSRSWKLWRRVGTFRGFGGEFLLPPKLVREGESWLAVTDSQAWHLDADCFGAVLQRADGLSATHGSLIQTDALEREAVEPLKTMTRPLKNLTSLVSLGSTAVALTTTHSHSIYLFLFDSV